MTCQRYLLSALVALSICISGCGGGGNDKATVAGNVTVDGKPLADGTITFNPVEGNTATAGGKITNGAYSVQVPKGMQKVIISAPKVTGTRPKYQGDPNSPLITITEETLPPKYSSQLETELTFEVKGGSNKHDISLTSTP